MVLMDGAPIMRDDEKGYHLAPVFFSKQHFTKASQDWVLMACKWLATIDFSLFG